jgi:hypothetical protein
MTTFRSEGERRVLRRPVSRTCPVLVLCLGVLMSGGWCATVKADGGTLRLSECSGGYRITTFTAPTPFRAGPVEISVLVQDETSGEPAREATVTIRLAPQERPAKILKHRASTEASTNKLFQAALFTLPEAGRWIIDVEVDGTKGPGRSRVVVDAAGPPPRWVTLWPWIAWPALVVVLFAVHQRLARRRHTS